MSERSIEDEENFESDMSSDVEYELQKNCGLALSKKPLRQNSINKNDILDLKIALETAKTVEEFISMF